MEVDRKVDEALQKLRESESELAGAWENFRKAAAAARTWSDNPVTAEGVIKEALDRARNEEEYQDDNYC